MYKANISYGQLKEHLIFLRDKDLLRYDEDTRTFKTTEKGLRFLQMYNQIDDMMKEEQLPLVEQQNGYRGKKRPNLRKHYSEFY